MKLVRQPRPVRRSSRKQQRLAGSGLSFVTLFAFAAGTGCSSEAGPFDQHEPGGEAVGSAEQAVTLACEGSAQACFGLSPLDCSYQRGCGWDPLGFCNGTATTCGLLDADACADQLGCFSPNGGSFPPPGSWLGLAPKLVNPTRTVRLGSAVSVAYVANAELFVTYEAQLATATTSWRSIGTYESGQRANFYVTPQQQGINRYRLRICKDRCSDEREFTIEAYPESSLLYTTYDEAPVSDEGTGVRQCPAGTGVVGVGCGYKFCDNVTLRCGDPARTTLPAANAAAADVTWTSFFSEEGNSTRTCPEGTMMVGIECDGDYCDDIRLACGPHRANTHRRNCAWSGYYSEESAPFVSAKNTAVFGVQCRGSYCDDKRYYTCEIADGPAPPPPPAPPDGSACTWVPSTGAAHNGGVVEVSRPQGACPYSYRERYYSSTGDLVNTVYR